MANNAQNTDHADANVVVTITNQVPGYYKCGHCALHFKTRERFRAHEVTCLSLKQIRARATFASSASSASSDGGGGGATDTVQMQDLLALVQQLAVRLETAEHELSVLKRQQQQQAKQQHKRDHPNEIDRGNLLQWLNNVALNNVALNNVALNNGVTAPKRPFSEWLAAIPAIGRDHLALVFQNGFIDGMCSIIASIARDACCALCAYDEAPGVLFVYAEALEAEAKDKANKWRHMTHDEFERFINRMQKLLMNEFVRWQEENKERWHDPDFAEQYDANLLKVTGSGKAKSGGCSNRDMLIARMKTKVYAAIKRSANG
jgi:hypothetical protein